MVARFGAVVDDAQSVHGAKENASVGQEQSAVFTIRVAQDVLAEEIGSRVVSAVKFGDALLGGEPKMMVGVLDNAHHVVVGQPVGTRNGFVSEGFVILAEGALQCAVAETAHPQCAAHICFQTVDFVGGQLFVVYFIGHEIVLGDVLPTGVHGIEPIVGGDVQPAVGRQLKVVYLGGIVIVDEELAKGYRASFTTCGTEQSAFPCGYPKTMVRVFLDIIEIVDRHDMGARLLGIPLFVDIETVAPCAYPFASGGVDKIGINGSLGMLLERELPCGGIEQIQLVVVGVKQNIAVS